MPTSTLPAGATDASRDPLRLAAPLLQTSPALLLVLDDAGAIRGASRGVDLFPADALRGRDVLQLVAARDRDALRAALGRALAGEPRTLDVGFPAADGSTSWMQATLSAALVEGRPHILLVAVDVTERRLEQERLERSEALLMDAQGVAHMGTWEWDVSQPRATWSDELYRIYGLTREAYEPTYEGYLRMVHPEDRPRVVEVTERAMREHVPYSHDERIVRPDGTIRYLHTWAHPIVDRHGRLRRLVGVCQDVTEQRRAAATIRTQTLTRGLARRLLLELITRAHVPQGVVRDLGRALARGASGEPAGEGAERPLDVHGHVEAFRDLGLGGLRFDRTEGTRYVFSATDLLERRSDASLPTCFMTLGYLEGVVSATSGKRALGNEMRCQSMGHKECVFVVMEQPGG